jgi:hypothetical protein
MRIALLGEGNQARSYKGTHTDQQDQLRSSSQSPWFQRKHQGREGASGPQASVLLGGTDKINVALNLAAWKKDHETKLTTKCKNLFNSTPSPASCGK